MIVLRPFTGFPIVNNQPDWNDATEIPAGIVVTERGKWLEGGILFTTYDGTEYVTDTETFDLAVTP